MALPIKELAVGFYNSQKTRMTNLIVNRPDKEKQIAVIVILIIFMGVDYLVLAKPCLEFIFKNAPEITSLKSKLNELKQDRKNKQLIDSNWRETTEQIEVKEKSFVTDNEIPVVLETISKLASESRTKITSLQPVEGLKKDQDKPKYNFPPLPIKIEGLAGVHELGTFLAKLESGTFFIRITDLRIYTNPSDMRKHLIGIDLETYKRGAAA